MGQEARGKRAVINGKNGNWSGFLGAGKRMSGGEDVGNVGACRAGINKCESFDAFASGDAQLDGNEEMSYI